MSGDSPEHACLRLTVRKYSTLCTNIFIEKKKQKTFLLKKQKQKKKTKKQNKTHKPERPKDVW